MQLLVFLCRGHEEVGWDVSSLADRGLGLVTALHNCSCDIQNTVAFMCQLYGHKLSYSVSSGYIHF